MKSLISLGLLYIVGIIQEVTEEVSQAIVCLTEKRLSDGSLVKMLSFQKTNCKLPSNSQKNRAPNAQKLQVKE